MISTIAFVTRDRPEDLGRAVRSTLENLERNDRRAEITVYDDGDDAEATISLLRALRSRQPIRYCGLAERAAYVSALQGASSLDPSVLAFALIPTAGASTSVGANRNVWLLDTIGTSAMTLDDDVVCKVGRVPGARPGLVVADEPEFEFWMHSSREAALSAVAPDDDDVLGLHELSLEAKVESAAPTNDRPASEPPRVLISTMGIAGDCGMGFPTGRLAFSGASRERIVGPDYDWMKLTRESVMGVSVATICSAPWLMLPCAAVDNTGFLPPFVPVQRGEDALFATLLRRARPSARLSHVPYAVVHDPSGRTAYGATELYRPLERWTFEELTHMILALAPPAKNAPEPWLERLGQQLTEIAGRTTSFVDGSLRAQRRRQIDRLNALLEQHGHAPASWAADVRQGISVASASLAGARPALPGDLAFVDADPSKATARMLTRLGALFTNWRAIRDAARRLREAGVRASRLLSPDIGASAPDS